MLLPLLAITTNGFASSGLAFSIFNNTALTGTPRFTSVVPSGIAFCDASSPFSATITGTMAVERGYEYNFSCSFGGAALGYAHIDGHLICQTGVNHPHAPAGRDVRSKTYDTPLPVLSSTEWPVRFVVVHNGSAIWDADDIFFGMRVTKVPVSEKLLNQIGDAAAVESSQFTPNLPKAEAQRDAMQSSLARGWAPWYDMSYTRYVRLPEGSMVTYALCESVAQGNRTAKCATETRTDWGPQDQMGAVLRLGPHAVDRSYAQLYLATPSCNISIETGGGDALVAKFGVVSGCDDAELVLIGGSAWQRMHAVKLTSPRSLVLSPYGDHVRTTTIYSTQPSAGVLMLPPDVADLPHIALPLGRTGSDAIGLTSDVALSLEAISSKLQAAWTAEQKRYERFGALAEAKMAVQAGVMWNTVFNPIESVIAPVIRGNPWGWDMAVVDDDWPFVLFDWDTHFAAYMLSLDSKELGYSVLIQIVKAKSASGFVPNGWAPTRKSTHSQPPVGSKVLHEMYRKFGDKWLVELLFDDLKDWSDWFDSQRRLAPLYITALGGDDMQAARYESGLDNSPMYDGEFFEAVPSMGDGFGLMQRASSRLEPAFYACPSSLLFPSETHTRGPSSSPIRAVYDVGMASMASMSDESLASLADALERTDDAAVLRARAKAMREKIGDHLWDPASGIFVNMFPNNTFNRRISPTSFYPMLAGAATAERATAMMNGWLLNSSRFCISPSGDFKGNTDSCYWGLPSISADDPAFPALGYWRGFVWGPMALLTYWGLSHEAYASLPAVAKARTALCAQMSELFLRQWRLNRHVCENFSPKRNATECTGMHFYHWGGLAGFIGLIDAGFYGGGAPRPSAGA
jgi:putative isomerase